MYKYPIQLTQQFRFCGNPFRIDLYRGCDFGCKYCFANNRRGGVKKGYDSAEINDIKKLFSKAFDYNSESKDLNVELLRHRVPLHLGGMSDPFHTREWQEGLSLEFLKISKQYDYPVIISTKASKLPDSYWDVLDSSIHAFQVSLFCIDKEFVSKYEYNTPTPQERIGFLRELKSRGFWCSLRLQPLIEIEQAVELCKAVDGLVDYITVEHLKIPADNSAMMKLFKFDSVKYYRPSSMRNWELRKPFKMKNIERIKEVVKTSRIGVGDNDCRELSQSRNCCGVDCIGGKFDNWLKYNQTYFATGNDSRDSWVPSCNVRSVLNPDTRKNGMSTFKQYVDDYMKKFENSDQMKMF